jgi:hypothetical protein
VLRGQAEARDQQADTSSNSQADEQLVEWKRQLRSARRECKAQREQCAHMVDRMVELQSELEDLREARDAAEQQAPEVPAADETDGAGGSATLGDEQVEPQCTHRSLLDAVRLARQMAAQQVEELGLPRETDRDWVELISELLEMDRHGELERSLRARLELTPGTMTPGVTAAPVASKGKKGHKEAARNKEIARRAGTVQLEEMRKVQRDLWGPDPVQRARELRRCVGDSGGSAKASQVLEEWEELDARRTLLLERLLWSSACGLIPETPAPRPKEGEEVAKAKAQRMETDAGGGQQQELHTALGQVASLQRELSEVRDGMTATHEAEVRRLRETVARLRREVLHLNGQLEDAEFEAAKAGAALQRADRRQQQAVAAAEEAAHRQVGTLQRQLEVAHQQAAQECAAIAGWQSKAEQHQSRREQLEDEVRELRAEAQQAERLADTRQHRPESRAERDGQRAPGQRQTLCTPGDGIPARGTGPRMLSRTPAGTPRGLHTPKADLEDGAIPWLVLVHGPREARVTAWIAGRDANGVLMAVHAEDPEAVNTVGWFVREAALCGATLWQVTTEVATQLDTGLTLDQLEQFAMEAAGTLPDLGAAPWVEQIQPDDNDSQSAAEDELEEPVCTGSWRVGQTLEVPVGEDRWERGQVVEMQGNCVMVMLRSGWTERGISGPRRLWLEDCSRRVKPGVCCCDIF